MPRHCHDALAHPAHSVAQWPSPVVHSPRLSQVAFPPRQLLAVATALSTVYFVGRHLFSVVLNRTDRVSHMVTQWSHHLPLCRLHSRPGCSLPQPPFSLRILQQMCFGGLLSPVSTPLSVRADFPMSSGLNSPHLSHIAFVARTPLTRCPSIHVHNSATQTPVSFCSALSTPRTRTRTRTCTRAPLTCCPSMFTTQAPVSLSCSLHYPR